ncbi:FtsX-like permease family protein [Arsenicitalea aurantiaca]|uniref:FtsX-like permease family protein n=1 Tax=Arsenicitalea aurantiaca TaxID=1783274 RepID=A0A433XLA8_9HYPH|nr:FtsX-like permease family protein [Arsenicitalea aurantiaca]RUT34853.1 FtsX-like permease family protein [Arsenicitalea aurantiaca]
MGLSRLQGWVRVALRDLRGDLRRFGVLLACIALGVGTLAAVGSTGAALQAAIDRDAVAFLGGDIEARLSYRAASEEERAFLETLGTVSAVTELSSRAGAEGAGALIELRAVEPDYPLVGAVETRNGVVDALEPLLAQRDGAHGALVDQLLLERLGIGEGGRFRIGTADFVVTGVLAALPDQAVSGFRLGIPVLISETALEQSGLIGPGVLARWRYKILLGEGQDYDGAAAALAARFPGQGWETRSPADAAENLSEFLDLFARFLMLVGLSSLLVGGVGVSNAVSAYVAERQGAIATLRSLGATGARVMVHLLVQILVLTAAGIAIGALLGALATLVALPMLGGLLSLELSASIHWPSLVTAGFFGLLVGFAFAYLPLRQAEALRPALLFRTASGGVTAGLGWRALLRPRNGLPLAIALGLVILLAMWTTGEWALVLWYAFGALIAFGVLRTVAALLQSVLRAMPRPRNGLLRNALKSIYRPGAAAPAVMLSLGLGLSLLLMIALIDSSLRTQLRNELSGDTPSFVFLNMSPADDRGLSALAQSDPRIAAYASTAMMRGIITAVNDVPVAEMGEIPRPVRWMFEGDTSLTWSRALPEGSALVAGEWWPADYAGPPLVSLSRTMAEPLGLSVGDAFEVTIQGRPIRATIASFREIEWRNRGFNFMIVFSPGLIEGAPATYLGTMTAGDGAVDEIQALLVRDFPELSFAPVGEALARVADILSSLTNAVALVGGLAVVSGVFVLAGAMSAGRRQREADAMVMKVLGATRAKVVLAYLVEYGLLGFISALFASVLGTLGAWAIVTHVLELQFAADPGLIALVIGGSVVLTMLVGVGVTWSALSVRPARYLRALG